MNTLFFHIPKTGGTYLANLYKNSLNCELYRFFTKNKIIEAIGEEQCGDIYDRLLHKHEIKAAKYAPLIDASQVREQNNVVVYAHEFDKQFDFIQQEPLRWSLITIVRSPIERFFSLYAQRQRGGSVSEIVNCDELYQFYFLYREWYRGDNKLELSSDTAPEILKESIRLLEKFDMIYDQNVITETFNNNYNLLSCVPQNSSNITRDEYMLNIPYSHIKKYNEYIDYDYDFYKAAIKIACS